VYDLDATKVTPNPANLLPNVWTLIGTKPRCANVIPLTARLSIGWGGGWYCTQCTTRSEYLVSLCRARDLYKTGMVRKDQQALDLGGMPPSASRNFPL